METHGRPQAKGGTASPTKFLTALGRRKKQLVVKGPGMGLWHPFETPPRNARVSKPSAKPPAVVTFRSVRLKGPAEPRIMYGAQRDAKLKE